MLRRGSTLTARHRSLRWSHSFKQSPVTPTSVLTGIGSLGNITMRITQSYSECRLVSGLLPCSVVRVANDLLVGHRMPTSVWREVRVKVVPLVLDPWVGGWGVRVSVTSWIGVSSGWERVPARSEGGISISVVGLVPRVGVGVATEGMVSRRIELPIPCSVSSGVWVTACGWKPLPHWIRVSGVGVWVTDCWRIWVSDSGWWIRVSSVEGINGRIGPWVGGEIRVGSRVRSGLSRIGTCWNAPWVAFPLRVNSSWLDLEGVGPRIPRRVTAQKALALNPRPRTSL